MIKTEFTSVFKEELARKRDGFLFLFRVSMNVAGALVVRFGTTGQLLGQRAVTPADTIFVIQVLILHFSRYCYKTLHHIK
jgi:hypothetical protein